MRENRLYGSEGGEVQKPSLTLSEATARGPWIASSQGLLAMTDGVIHVPQVDFLILGVSLPRIDSIIWPRRLRSSIVRTGELA